MADSSSPKFLSFEKRFCSNIESVVTRNVSFGGCKINSLSKGSIIVNFTLAITNPMSVNETRDLLLCLFNGTQVGTMRVDSRATQFIFNPHGNETIVSKESSSCSSDYSLPISPMSYTYPDYCGDYQVCIQGNSVLQTCPQGQEFAYLSPGDTVICAPPSHNTYCGQKKSEMEKTTSRLPSSTSVTDSKQEVKLSTDTSQNALAYATSSLFPTTTTTTTTTAMDCSNVFTCSSSYTFMPANDTYPDNCGKYQECIGGKSKVRYCAEGSHFVYSQQNINACHGTDDPLTYCNMMTFFKSACSENSKHFVTTESQDQASRLPSFP
ncbi:uncharacterized protein LOC112554893 [Pomacea canaliculata]|nr:uncharacterized protein LOC112554893 [Pomacea canaliculata]